ncbi:MAG: hypothetical protein AAGD96_23460 [Chloroflexota bacterium]
MFAKHNSLKSNHANAYRVLAQTSLCPAESPAQLGHSIRMIQSLSISNAIGGWQLVGTSLGGQIHLDFDQQGLVRKAEGFRSQKRQSTIRFQHSLIGGSPS